MYRQFFTGMAFTELPLFALLLFFTMFVAVVIRVSVKKRRGELDRIERLPLEDGDPAPPRAAEGGRP